MHERLPKIPVKQPEKPRPPRVTRIEEVAKKHDKKTGKWKNQIN